MRGGKFRAHFKKKVSASKIKTLKNKLSEMYKPKYQIYFDPMLAAVRIE